MPSGPVPSSATCMRMPFVSMVRCCTSLIVVSSRYEGSRLGHHCHHAPCKLGIAIDAARLEQMLNLDGQLMDGRVPGGEPHQGAPEIKSVLEVRWTLSPGLRINQVRGCRHRPGRLYERLNLGEEGWRQADKRIAFRGACLQKSMHQPCLLSGHAHALTVDGIEAADCVAHGQNPRGKAPSRSKCRHTLAGKPKRAISPRRSACLIALYTVGVRNCRT